MNRKHVTLHVTYEHPRTLHAADWVRALNAVGAYGSVTVEPGEDHAKLSAIKADRDNLVELLRSIVSNNGGDDPKRCVPLEIRSMVRQELAGRL